MTSQNISLRISGELRQFVKVQTGEKGRYETPSEYIRDLIRQDMDAQRGYENAAIKRGIAEATQQMLDGKLVKYTGDFEKDYASMLEKEEAGWE